MRAIVVRETGSLDVLKMEDLPDPEVGPDDVVVKVHAVGVNGADVGLSRPGDRRALRQPRVMGGDAAGTVHAVGPEVRQARPGQRVLVNPGVSCGVCERCLMGADNTCASYALMGYGLLNGGYAEYVKVPEANIVPLPDEVSFVDAATIPVVWITAWHMLVDVARVRPGETVLVLPAGSGVGTAAIQVARLFGGRVIAAAGSAWKLERAEGLGAEAGVDYAQAGWGDRVRELTGSRGVDVVIDASRGPAFLAAIASMAVGGRAVTAAPGADSAIEVRRLSRDQGVFGVLMGPKASLVQMLRLFRQGRLKAVVHAVYPISEVQRAHADLIERRAFGKVVMTWG